MASAPSVLLLDEPAAGLDDNETGELGDLVRRFADRAGMAVLLIEHDVELVLAVCDRIVVLDFGRKIAEGTPADIRNDPADPDNISDPRVFYDQLSRRWLAIEIDFSNNVMLARSNTGDPTGAWKAVKWNAGSTLPDYPTLGFDANGIYVGADMNGSSGVISLWSIPKSDILASTPTLANMSSFTNRSTSATVAGAPMSRRSASSTCVSPCAAREIMSSACHCRRVSPSGRSRRSSSPRHAFATP